MAYVVPRRNGRFEVRESVHTPRGPRARTLAGFRVLTDEVLLAAKRRATRQFDSEAVLSSAERVGAPVRTSRHSAHRFVDTSRRMALAFSRPPASKPMDPGAVLIDLLGFADAVRASQPPRRFEPLAFPALGGLAAERPRGAVGTSGR